MLCRQARSFCRACCRALSRLSMGSSTQKYPMQLALLTPDTMQKQHGPD